MSLYEKIHGDLKESMKAKDALRTSTLRMLLSALQYRQDAVAKQAVSKGEDIPDGGVGLSDEEVVRIVRTQVKQRNESIEEFRKGSREELAAKEEKEKAILEEYLPAGLSDDELSGIVEEAVTETGATSKKDMGKMMKAVMAKVAGRADGKTVQQAVVKRLSEF